MENFTNTSVYICNNCNLLFFEKIFTWSTLLVSHDAMHYKIVWDFQLLNDSLQFKNFEFECYVSYKLNYENREKYLP